MKTKKENLTEASPPKAKINENVIIRRISIVGIAGNVLLFAFKLFAGILGRSGAMISDAIHSLSDVIATFIAFIGVRMSKKGADKKHPYGHERFECVASLLLGAILLFTGFEIGKAGLENILSSNHENLAVPSAIALIASIISIASKEAMYWYTRHYAKILNSAAFMADALHHRSDAFSSIGSLIGIAGAMLGFPVMDSIACVVICLFIIKAAYDVFSETVKKLVDTSCEQSIVDEIRCEVLKQNDVVCVDELKTRMFGSKIYVDLEIGADETISFKKAHAVAENVHHAIEKNFPEVKHCMVHVNTNELSHSA